MTDNNKDDKTPQSEENKEKNLTLIYVAIGCFAAGCVLLALTFVFTFAAKNGTGIYFLISSMIAELAAVTFLNRQKQKFGGSKLRTVFVILSYIVMATALIIFIMGTSAAGASSNS